MASRSLVRCVTPIALWGVVTTLLVIFARFRPPTPFGFGFLVGLSGMLGYKALVGLLPATSSIGSPRSENVARGVAMLILVAGAILTLPSAHGAAELVALVGGVLVCGSMAFLSFMRARRSSILRTTRDDPQV